MRIAITSEGGGMDGKVAAHFGRCPEYVFIEIEENVIKSSTIIPNPYFNNHVPGAVPKFIKENNADVIITSGCGPMAVNLFKELNIKLIVGVSGKISDVVSDYLSGKLETENNTCSH
jgi:predicted Fe-Mo cluster-binding NifX family protein